MIKINNINKIILINGMKYFISLIHEQNKKYIFDLYIRDKSNIIFTN